MSKIIKIAFMKICNIHEQSLDIHFHVDRHKFMINDNMTLKRIIKLIPRLHLKKSVKKVILKKNQNEIIK